MPRFRKKPIVINAVQLRWDTWSEMCDHAGVGKLSDGKPEGCYVNDNGYILEYGEITKNPRLGLKIPTLEGIIIASEGDWIIRGIIGELYACKPEIFETTYDSIPKEEPE